MHQCMQTMNAVSLQIWSTSGSRISFLPFTSTSGSSSIFILVFSVMRPLLSSEPPDRLNKTHTKHNTFQQCSNCNPVCTVQPPLYQPPKHTYTCTYTYTHTHTHHTAAAKTDLRTFDICRHFISHMHKYTQTKHTHPSTTMARQAGLYRSGSQGKDWK